jgi:hypothetical protein
MINADTDTLMRFADKFEVIEGHWLWTASMLHNYGGFWFEGRLQPAHVVSYKMFIGPVQEGMVVHHKCRIKLCVHPNCLEQTTQAQNLAYEVKPTCKYGHDVSILGRTKSGNCKACMKEYLQKYYQDHK